MPPTSLLSDLRAAHADPPAHSLTTVIKTWKLRPLTGGRNNLVYAWTAPDGRQICLKFYKADERRRAEREWHALTLLAAHGINGVPAPLWYDPAPLHPAIGMTLLPGTPFPATATAALKALAVLHTRLQEAPSPARSPTSNASTPPATTSTA